MKKPLALLLLFLLGLSLAVLAACDDATPEHVHEYTLECTVLEDEHDISLSYACECGDSAVSSLAVRLTGRTGVAETVQPDEDGIADWKFCSATPYFTKLLRFFRPLLTINLLTDTNTRTATR